MNIVKCRHKGCLGHCFYSAEICPTFTPKNTHALVEFLTALLTYLSVYVEVDDPIKG